ncbi:MAG: HIT family protein [Phycisphaerae bacterium]|jgi:histidine triad (HIT) family protein
MAAGELAADCVFCKIIRGEIPSQRVFEDEHVLGFLDIQPLAAGHTILIPRHHAKTLAELPAEWAAALAQAFGRVAQAVVSVVGAQGCNVLLNDGEVAGQVVPHVHFHIVPRRPADGLGYRWKASPAPPEQLATLAERVRAAL